MIGVICLYVNKWHRWVVSVEESLTIWLPEARRNIALAYSGLKTFTIKVVSK